jgi:hypothetical protein
MNNNTSIEPVEPVEPVEQSEQPVKPVQPSLTEIEIVDENIALNVMVSFLHLAQKRGAFNIQESGKLWECVKLFMKRE